MLGRDSPLNDLRSMSLYLTGLHRTKALIYKGKNRYENHPRSRHKLCPGCGNNMSHMSSYCKRCVVIVNKRKAIDSWLSGEWSGTGEKSKLLSTTIRKYLLEEADYKCSQCGFSGFHPVGGWSILEIDHINGLSYDNRPENLRVLCPNCHAMTPTFRASNIGVGKQSYYVPVADRK